MTINASVSQLFFRLCYDFFMPFNTYVLITSTKALIKCVDHNFLQIKFWNSKELTANSHVFHVALLPMLPAPNIARTATLSVVPEVMMTCNRQLLHYPQLPLAGQISKLYCSCTVFQLGGGECGGVSGVRRECLNG